MKKYDLKGKTFGYYKVLELAEPRNGVRTWKCECTLCGNIRYVSTHALVSGKQKSCGCQSYVGEKNGFYSHGLSNHKLNALWRNIKTRCYNPRCQSYNNYGLKGIKMCDEWKNNFMAFYEWAINNGYKEGLSIERLDYTKDYEPSNCTFITMAEQQRNKSNLRMITYNGETHCLAEWCRVLNISYYRTISRIKNGWTIKEAFENENYQKKN